MPTYTDRAAVAAYLTAGGVGNALPTDNTAADALIVRAEEDVDSVLGPWQLLPTRRKLDPSLLEADEQAALARCVACQVEHRLEVGEANIRAGYNTATPLQSVEGPDFKKTYAVSVVKQPVRRYSPRLRGELEGIGHLIVSGGVALP